MVGNFFIYFIERSIIIQVHLPGTPEQKSKNSADPNEALRTDF